MIDHSCDIDDDAGGNGSMYLPSSAGVRPCAAPAVTAENVRSSMDRFKLQMRRFRHVFETLPFNTRCTCPSCGKVVEACFDHAEGGVAVKFDCPSCGRPEQFHYDGIYTRIRSDHPDSAKCTLTGTRIRPILRGLPRTVETLCPDCQAILVGRYFVEDGAVWIEKTCPEHGYFRDCINRDVQLYAKAMYWSFQEPVGQRYPQVRGAADCPSDCGLCNQHQSSACLANIDLTNRCNLRCPVCFANSGAVGYVYEPSFEQVVVLLQQLRDLR
ncbi:MAG: hypothetical protein HQ546_08575, partial [Planctomycetes bacterium]|nr:hypothetical protein [Planctomycetota bacterium]